VSTADLDAGAPVETVRRLLASVSSRLQSDSEAKWIVAQAAGVVPGDLLGVLDSPVSTATATTAAAMSERRAGGEPVQYVLGTWSFRHIEVSVDSRALIPRPETEQVVDVALEELRRLSGPVGPAREGPAVLVDLGTGSGVIALTLALETGAEVEVWATDASAAALELAGDNLLKLAGSGPMTSRLRLAEGSWFGALPARLSGHVHMVVSNPPYVSASEWSDLDPQIRDYEPRVSLVSGITGLEALELLVDEARQWLVPSGSLVLELAPHQATTMAARAERAGYLDVRVRPDLSGRDRILVASWPGAR
jgi:release factor glutamine methyltransferase